MDAAGHESSIAPEEARRSSKAALILPAVTATGSASDDTHVSLSPIGQPGCSDHGVGTVERQRAKLAGKGLRGTSAPLRWLGGRPDVVTGAKNVESSAVGEAKCNHQHH